MKSNFYKSSYVTIFFFTIFLSCFSFKAVSHEGHPHPVDKNEAIEKANKVIAKAIDQKSLDSSWKEAKMEEAKTTETGEGQWVIKYSNPKITDNNKVLFVFLTLDGKYIAMNHTGK